MASLAADMLTAMEAGTAALILLRQLGDVFDGMIVALTSLGSSATIMGEPDAGRPYLHEAIALAEQNPGTSAPSPTRWLCSAGPP